ncbi:hypothetical protein M3603_11085 [Rummeliibacillus stabekisii]|uniref:hypothetical protein n=1 Tax=Rummeliibacillus stabekisii TaxID=241244 RepID=UPI00203E83D6|nr:hypothetical protein [Rummeliibacillus stabekisii]MCM3317190.1 hypothetical protein [Rummeliibacillus stabekisii]
MKGCLKWFIYLILIIIGISACTAIFGDKKSKGDSKSKKARETKLVYSYDEDRAIANKSGAFTIPLKLENGYKAKLTDTNVKIKKESNSNYTLSGKISKEKPKASYKIVLVNGKDKKIATIKVSNKKANVAYKKEQVRAEALKNEEEFPYGMLNKSQKGYKGKPYHITKGHVMQAIEVNGKTFLLVEITNKGYGYYEDIIAVNFDKKTDAIEGDLIEVYGTLKEKFDYDTQIGGSNSVPAMIADSVKVIEKVN